MLKLSAYAQFPWMVDLNMKTDVLLPSDILKHFRKQCLKAYGLDAANYFTKIKLQLITEINELMFTELGVIGGCVQCSNRYPRENNAYMEVYN